MTRHLILAYGQPTEHWRATFAILSFWAWYTGDRAQARTVLFTDNPSFYTDFLAGLPVEYVTITPEWLQETHKPQGYVHRTKIAIIDRAFRDYPHDNLLFCDSDTFFVAPTNSLLALLRPGVSAMHQREFTFADAVAIYTDFKPAGQERYPLQLIKLIERQGFRIDGQMRRFHATDFVWNSGVLGLTPEVADLLPDVFALNDALYAGSEWFITEQIAFSLALPARTELVASNAYVYHYWGKQQKILIDSFLGKTIQEQLAPLPLPERLEKVRRLTLHWRHIIQNDKARQDALYAFSTGQLVAGAKCAAKTLLASPFQPTFLKEVLVAITQRARA